jgi:UDP-glucuronate 4-epimerase
LKRPARVLVTGGAGFIGSRLVDRLLAEGRRVVALDSFEPFYPEAHKRENLADASRSEHFRLERGDIRDAGLLARLFAEERFEAVAHLAARAGVRPSLVEPAEFADVNVTGSARVFEACVAAEVPHVVFASSSSVYGEREGGPFRESDAVERPVSPYAATKRAGELLAHAFQATRGLSVTCARIFTAFGPRQRPDLAIRRFAERMLRRQPIPVFGDGSSLRDFTYVDDLVDGLVRALDRPLGFAILNLGAGRTVSLRQVIEALEKALGVEARVEHLPLQAGDVSRTWADIGAAREALGYAPGTSFEEGLARFVDWLRQHS